MIVFEEELKKFHKSLELDETEETAMAEDLTDAIDVVIQMAGGFDTMVE